MNFDDAMVLHLPRIKSDHHPVCVLACNSDQAEMWAALLLGLKLAWHLCFKHIILKMDSSLLVAASSGGSSSSIHCTTLFYEIFKFLSFD